MAIPEAEQVAATQKAARNSVFARLQQKAESVLAGVVGAAAENRLKQWIKESRREDGTLDAHALYDKITSSNAALNYLAGDVVDNIPGLVVTAVDHEKAAHLLTAEIDPAAMAVGGAEELFSQLGKQKGVSLDASPEFATVTIDYVVMFERLSEAYQLERDRAYQVAVVENGDSEALFANEYPANFAEYFGTSIADANQQELGELVRLYMELAAERAPHIAAENVQNMFGDVIANLADGDMTRDRDSGTLTLTFNMDTLRTQAHTVAKTMAHDIAAVKDEHSVFIPEGITGAKYDDASKRLVLDIDARLMGKSMADRVNMAQKHPYIGQFMKVKLAEFLGEEITADEIDPLVNGKAVAQLSAFADGDNLVRLFFGSLRLLGRPNVIMQSPAAVEEGINAVMEHAYSIENFDIMKTVIEGAEHLGDGGVLGAMRFMQYVLGQGLQISEQQHKPASVTGDYEPYIAAKRIQIEGEGGEYITPKLLQVVDEHNARVQAALGQEHGVQSDVQVTESSVQRQAAMDIEQAARNAKLN